MPSDVQLDNSNVSEVHKGRCVHKFRQIDAYLSRHEIRVEQGGKPRFLGRILLVHRHLQGRCEQVSKIAAQKADNKKTILQNRLT